MRIGEVYRKNSWWQKNQWDKLMNLLLELETEPNSLHTGIDLGCGTGERTLDFLKRNPTIKKICAIDGNPSMIQCAKARFSNKKIKYQIKKIEKTDTLKLKTVDFILSNYSIHWIKNKTKVLQALNKKSKKGTLLLIGTVEALPNMLETIDRYLRKAWGIKKRSPHHYLNKNHWIRLLDKFGWDILIEKQQKDLHTVKSGGSFLREWYAASAGAAFYNKDVNELKGTTIKKLEELLSDQYGANKNTEWVYEEQTFLFIARKR